MSQNEIDLHMGRGIGTYGKVVRGSLRPTEQYTWELAETLDLSEGEFVTVFRHWHRRDPARPLRATKLQLASTWQGVIERQVDMAYMSDASSDMIMCNEPFLRLFPSKKAPPNSMEWMLFSEEARDGTLIDWEGGSGGWLTVWAPRILPTLRAALDTMPNNRKLNELRQRVVEDADLEPVWNGPRPPYVTPDADIRPIKHDELGPGRVEIIFASPLTSPLNHFVLLVFQKGLHDPAKNVSVPAG
ncbi:hypothetical protein ACFWZ2_40225 [Streptomyces sp. NPDC059002]|uniref:hypothetical protein n=1 Tax=Streptomyces sp. NPDC059002 TaxID=3346690 RepID=UPI0036CE9999